MLTILLLLALLVAAAMIIKRIGWPAGLAGRLSAWLPSLTISWGRVPPSSAPSSPPLASTGAAAGSEKGGQP